MTVESLFSTAWRPALNPIGFPPRQLHERNTWLKLRVCKLRCLQLAAEYALQRPKPLTALIARKGNHGSDLTEEVIGLPLEVAGVLGQQHNDRPFGSALPNQVNQRLRLLLVKNLSCLIDD